MYVCLSLSKSHSLTLPNSHINFLNQVIAEGMGGLDEARANCPPDSESYIYVRKSPKNLTLFFKKTFTS